MNRSEFKDALDRIENEPRPNQAHLNGLRSLHSIAIDEGWEGEFGDRLEELDDELSTRIHSLELGRRMGGEPLGRENLIDLVIASRALQSKAGNRTSAEALDLHALWLLFERNVARPEAIQEVARRDDPLSPEEVVDLALSPAAQTTIKLPGQIDQNWNQGG